MFRLSFIGGAVLLIFQQQQAMHTRTFSAVMPRESAFSLSFRTLACIVLLGSVVVDRAAAACSYDAGLLQWNCCCQNLASVPTSLPPNTSKLDLSSNAFITIENDAFAQLTGLFQLVFTQNQITSINENSFRGLSGLYYLYLDDNQISSIAVGAFASLVSLYSLVLTGNLLPSLPTAGLFTTNNGLMKLDLSYNRVTFIEKGVFTGLNSLQYLTLMSNNLTSIASGSMDGLRSIQTLDFSSNQIASIADDALVRLGSLNSLDLSSNAIPNFLASNVTVLPHQLQNLALQSNSISVIAKGALSKVPGIQFLHLQGNRLTTLVAGAFYGLQGIMQIELGDNKLRTIEKGAFLGLRQLKLLFVYGNVAATVCIPATWPLDELTSPEATVIYGPICCDESGPANAVPRCKHRDIPAHSANTTLG
eukprot:m.59913 g.59913  ORF g.59913 m.59913 type:complete len:420 (+) comp12261_c1_seq1:242-1501(+)